MNLTQYEKSPSHINDLINYCKVELQCKWNETQKCAFEVYVELYVSSTILNNGIAFFWLKTNPKILQKHLLIFERQKFSALYGLEIDFMWH